ncbi:MAG: cytochrome c oxidase subunit I [Planctomycetes bacterium]|jgi:cytochrome c oxidase subunit 1|nr:cytochrome c oxidase subunit I [Planctomycetota bacterium]MDP6425045.1 cbb3-type cytochrome c oxidase subunit I [Planctomycetota bacterium]
MGFVRKYIFSTDHKVIGIQYIVTAIIMAFAGGGLAGLIRLQLSNPDGAIVSPETYLSLVTMHGTIMVFFVVSLGLVSGLGNFLIPLHVGARDMAYPLLNMLSYWTVVPACILMLLSFLAEGGAAAAGWTMYPPLSAVADSVPGSGMGTTLWLLSMALFIVSFTMGSLNFVATILNMRAPGLSMMRLPIVLWTYFISSILGLLSFPALTAAAIMLLFDRHLGTSFFLPAGMVFADHVLPNQGGTPLLFQHLFWFLGHPEVYVLVLPAIGVAFDVVATFTRRPPLGYRTTVYSLLLIAFLSMIVWAHHMFVTGMDPRVGKYFSVATVLITAPFGVLGVNLLLSLWKARMRFTVPMMFALGLISAIGAGGLGGLYLGTQTSDVYFHETYFVVGHFHLMIGTVTLLGTFAALYYWFPKMFGRHMSTALGKIHFWVTYPGMVAIFIMMHYQGLGGMLRRSYDPSVYDYNTPNLVLRLPITVIAFVVLAAQLVFVWNFFKSSIWGEKAPANPWDSASIEWQAASPPPHGNWGEAIPAVHRWPYDYRLPGASEEYLPQTTERA